MRETDMAKIARLVADPHAEALAAKDAEIVALTEESENWKQAANLWMGKALERARAISAASAAL